MKPVEGIHMAEVVSTGTAIRGEPGYVLSIQENDGETRGAHIRITCPRSALIKWLESALAILREGKSLNIGGFS